MRVAHTKSFCGAIIGHIRRSYWTYGTGAQILQITPAPFLHYFFFFFFCQSHQTLLLFKHYDQSEICQNFSPDCTSNTYSISNDGFWFEVDWCGFGAWRWHTAGRGWVWREVRRPLLLMLLQTRLRRNLRLLLRLWRLLLLGQQLRLKKETITPL